MVRFVDACSAKAAMIIAAHHRSSYQVEVDAVGSSL